MITDYATLKTAVSDWLARDDLADRIGDFIVFGENRIYRRLRIKAMETALSGTISGGVLAVPADYVELKYAYINQSPVSILSRTNAENIHLHYSTRSASGTPKYISRDGSNFIFGPYPDSDYTVSGTYYARLAALSDSNTTNWFTSYGQDLLLYAALLEAANYVQDDASFQKYSALFDSALSQIQSTDDAENFSGSSLASRVR